MEIKGFEGEDIKVSKFGEWVGPSYIDYKFEYNNQIKIIKDLYRENQQLKEQVEYLRRSVERKEEIILDLRNENTLHSDEYVSNLEKENQQLKAYNKFLMKKDNTLQSLLQWLYKEKENMKYSSVYINYIMIIINKIKELEMSDKLRIN